MKGVYALLIKLGEDEEITCGRLGLIKFKKGFYAYIGSAMNLLENRVRRHIKKQKKTFWHIDTIF
jgi:Uri superfamily endonuclease